MSYATFYQHMNPRAKIRTYRENFIHQPISGYTAASAAANFFQQNHSSLSKRKRADRRCIIIQEQPARSTSHVKIREKKQLARVRSKPAVPNRYHGDVAVDRAIAIASETDDESTTIKDLLWAKKWKRACSRDSESFDSLTSSESLQTLCDSNAHTSDVTQKADFDNNDDDDGDDDYEKEDELTKDDVQFLFLLDKTGNSIAVWLLHFIDFPWSCGLSVKSFIYEWIYTSNTLALLQQLRLLMETSCVLFHLNLCYCTHHFFDLTKKASTRSRSSAGTLTSSKSVQQA